MSCGEACRHGSDPSLLWLWHKLAAAAPILPLAWETSYAVGTAVSETGKVIGPWKQLPDPVYPENGGHGMVFADQDGSYKFLLHYPNDKYKERPRFTTLLESDSKLQLV